MEKLKKTKVLTVVFLILGLTLLTGVTYATFRYAFTGNKNVIDTANVELELLESTTEIISVSNALPKSDKEGILQEETFNFAVTTRTSAVKDIGYSLQIEKLDVDTGYTAFNDNQVKVYLTDYNDNELLAPSLISNLDNYLLYGKTNSHNSSVTGIQDKYKLRVWIDWDVDASNWTSDTKLQYKFKIGVTEKQEKMTAAEFLIANVGKYGLEEVNHTADSTLQIGASESITEYRYRGGDDVVTNNYVYFNCNDINNQSLDTCELYRVVGVFPVDDGTGNIENRVKLIKFESYGLSYWDENGTNNWIDSTLNTEFNNTYYDSINTKYQSLIGNSKYYLGGYKSSDINTDVMYQYERKLEDVTYYYSENPVNFIGKIALMYASDYGYSANSACSESKTLYNYESGTCSDNNWLHFGENEWLITPRPTHSNIVFGISASGYIYSNRYVNNNYKYLSRPVFYLTANAEFNNNGDGTFEKPYQLKE